MHGGDATKESGYRKIPKRPDFVSIEMLPYEGSDMALERQEKSGNNIHPDPFLPSLFMLSQKFPRLVETICFPHSIQAECDFGDEKGLQLSRVDLS